MFSSLLLFFFFFFFFFNDTATTEIYTLSLHDALPISRLMRIGLVGKLRREVRAATLAVRDELLVQQFARRQVDRKSTRLNSSHSQISYAVFCLKKKINKT